MSQSQVNHHILCQVTHGTPEMLQWSWSPLPPDQPDSSWCPTVLLVGVFITRRLTLLLRIALYSLFIGTCDYWRWFHLESQEKRLWTGFDTNSSAVMAYDCTCFDSFMTELVLLEFVLLINGLGGRFNECTNHIKHSHFCGFYILCVQYGKLGLFIGSVRWLWLFLKGKRSVFVRKSTLNIK